MRHKDARAIKCQPPVDAADDGARPETVLPQHLALVVRVQGRTGSRTSGHGEHDIAAIPGRLASTIEAPKSWSSSRPSCGQFRAVVASPCSRSGEDRHRMSPRNRQRIAPVLRSMASTGSPWSASATGAEVASPVPTIQHAPFFIDRRGGPDRRSRGSPHHLAIAPVADRFGIRHGVRRPDQRSRPGIQRNDCAVGGAAQRCLGSAPTLISDADSGT